MIQILMATYNGERYLKEQLDSLLNQTFKDFQIIVRDDCSSDKTISILKQYAAKYPEKIQIYQNTKPTGNAKDNFFRLMHDATADFVCFCDQDDVWLPNKLQVTYQKMLQYSQQTPVLIHTDLRVVDQNLHLVHKSFFRMQHFERRHKLCLNKAIAQNTVTGCTVMINKALLDLAKDTNHHDIIMHDWWLAMIACAFGSVGVVNAPTMLYRQHGNNAVGAKSFWKSFRFSRKIKKNITAALDVSFRQAACFAETFKNILPPQILQPILSFSNMPYLSKSKQLNLLIHYHFWKQSFMRKAVQVAIVLWPF